MPADVYPPDFTSNLGKVRALIPDVEHVDFTGEGIPTYMFSDVHLASLLSLYVDRPSLTGMIKRTAADALTAIAVSEALISKVIRTEDLQTDGAKVANALLAAAKRLKDDADRDDEEAEERLGYAFAIVDYQPSPPDPIPYGLRGFPDFYGHAGNYAHGSGFGSWL